MDLASFDERFLQSNEVQSLMGKVKVKGEIELDRYFPQSWPGRVKITVADGRSHVHEIIIPKGETANPMSARELEEKFLNLATPLLGEAGARLVIHEIDALDQSDSLEGFISALKLR